MKRLRSKLEVQQDGQSTGSGLRSRVILRSVLFAGFIAFAPVLTAALAQAPAKSGDAEAIHGAVLDLASKPVAGASVQVEREGSNSVQTTTDAAGKFVFPSLPPGHYVLHAEKLGQRSPSINLNLPAAGSQGDLALVIGEPDGTHPGAASASAAAPMEFADQPNFTIAGVTDWTAVGGHGSDATLRTSESLARQTVSLHSDDRERSLPGLPVVSEEAGKSESELREAVAREPQNYRANHELGDFYLRAGRDREAIPLLEAAGRIDPSNRGNAYELALADKMAGELAEARTTVQRLLSAAPNADVHRLAGEIDEAQGDPLTAVHEFEEAVRLDASEQNYFEWGSELLVHRAVWQAQEVFSKGAETYPKSARMLTALGTAFFAGALYEKAAQRLCEASDLSPADPQPYEFMGKVEMAAPNPLPCIEERLARFAKEQQASSEANYLYAMAILKRQQQQPNAENVQRAEALLTNAVTIDSKCSDAYLQLGILSSSRRQMNEAVQFFTKAIAANPQLGEAHYRLAVTYDRLGEREKAQKEFALHDEIAKQQAEAIEQQRREVKQFEVKTQAQKN